MKIIQANIWVGKLKFQLTDFFEEQPADIVCMQEVSDLKGSAGPFFATLEDVVEAGNFSDSAMAPVYRANYMNRDMGFGNAVASKFPIVESKTIFTYGGYQEQADELESDMNVRNFQHLVLDVAGKRLNVLNHHGFYVAGSKAGNQETLRQMNIIAEYIKKLDGPIILCGDLNLTPETESMRVFNGLLTNLSAKNNLTSTFTDLNFNNAVSDYILVNDQVTVNSFEMLEVLISDHKALILDFDI